MWGALVGELWKCVRSSTLVCMRRRILKRLLPKCHCVQTRNPRCSQSRCHPLRGETIQISCSILIQKANIHHFLPELSSLTSDDIVLVMESAAMRRSFLRFLRGPFKTQRQKKKNKKESFYISIWTYAWLWAWLWYPERRPPERHPQRPLASPEVCASALWQQSRSGWAWGWSGWWCDWGKSVESQDPESAAQKAYFSSFCSDFLIWPSLGIKGTGLGCPIIVSHKWNKYFTREYLHCCSFT